MSERPLNSFALLFARLSWMVFGPFALVLSLPAIFRSSEAAISIADIVFFGIIVAMIGCRFFEFRSGQALTATGDPMTRAVIVRYSLVLLIVGLVGFAAVKALAVGLLHV